MTQFITHAKLFLSGGSRLSSLICGVFVPMWVQEIPGLNSKLVETLGVGAETVIIAYVILLIVRSLKPAKDGVIDLPSTLVKLSLTLANIAAMQTRQLAKEDAIIARFEAAKLAMASTPDTHERLLEMGNATLERLETSARSDQTIVNNQAAIREQLSRIENNVGS